MDRAERFRRTAAVLATTMAISGLASGNVLAETWNVTADANAGSNSEIPMGKWARDGDGGWRHISPAGIPHVGWFQDADGGWYYLEPDGVMRSGRWFQDTDSKWYYLNVDGRMLANQWFLDADNAWYYLDGNGVMMKNCTTPDGYQVTESGVWDGLWQHAVSGVLSGGGSSGGSGHSGGGGGSGGAGSGTGSSNAGSGSGSEETGSSNAEGGSGNGETGSSNTGGGGSQEIVGSNGTGTGGGDNGTDSVGETENEAAGSGTGSADGIENAENTPEHKIPENNTAGNTENVNGSENSSENGSGDANSDPSPATPSEAEEVKLSWRVRFTDKETHQMELAPLRSGKIREGEELVINFRRRIVDGEGRIWESVEEPPLTPEIYGFGNWLYEIEYEQTGVLADAENPYETEKQQLSVWYETAKKAESNLTGEAAETIPDRRFLVENREENNARLIAMADRIPASGEAQVFVIGKNMIPNGMILETVFRDEIEYSHMEEDRISIGEDTFYVACFVIRSKPDTENCRHNFEETSRLEPTCLAKGSTVFVCTLCGVQKEVGKAALGHLDSDNDRLCDRCGKELDDSSKEEAERVHWKIGDIQEAEIDGETYRFRCIDQNYADGMETHRQTALFLCDSVIPADYGSDYRLEENEDGGYEHRFVAGPIVNFGNSSDYKYSAVRSWLTDSEQNVPSAEPVNIGVSRAYTGSTGEGTYSQFDESDLRGSYIGSQRLSGKLFLLSVDEAFRYRDYLWKFDGSGEENPETQIGPFCKGYWLRTPEGNNGNHSTGKAYIVDLVNGNIRPEFVSPELAERDGEAGGNAGAERMTAERKGAENGEISDGNAACEREIGNHTDMELRLTGTTGVRPVFTMPQD